MIRKIILISKSIASHPGYQTVVIHILTNISRSKDNQVMKFGQLIEYIIRNIFLEKSFTKCGRKTFPRPFSKKLKYLWINILKFCMFCFVWQFEDYRK